MIAQEGAIQIFHEPNSGMEEVIVGAVGVLQFEVRDGAAMHDQVQAQLEDTEFVASFYAQTQCRHSSRTQ